MANRAGVDAIAQDHQTTVRCVIELQNILHPTEQYSPEFKSNFQD